MKPEVLNKIIELNKISGWITIPQLVRELSEFGNSNDIVNELLNDKIIEKITEEKVDICSFNTLKLKRILKLKNLPN